MFSCVIQDSVMTQWPIGMRLFLAEGPKGHPCSFQDGDEVPNPRGCAEEDHIDQISSIDHWHSLIMFYHVLSCFYHVLSCFIMFLSSFIMFYPFTLDSSVIIIGVAPSCLYLQGWGVAWRRMDDKLIATMPLFADCCSCCEFKVSIHGTCELDGAVTDQARQLYNMKWWVNIGNIRGWSGWKEWLTLEANRISCVSHR